MDYDIIIIGAGASGLVAAISAARSRGNIKQGSSSKILVIEQKDRAGKKILATGNGKCNFTNLLQLPECYRSDDSTFATKVLSNFDVHKTITFFEELGIYPKERNGYLYPNSEQASSVVDVLLIECKRLNIDIIYNEKVISIRKPYYTVETKPVQAVEDNFTRKYSCRCLILSTGGCASPKLGSDGSGYVLSQSLGHSLIKPLPALVQLKASNKFCKRVSGVRSIAKVSAYCGDIQLASEKGEIIFTDYGISGIPIMQISRFISKAIDRDQIVKLRVDFLPELSETALVELINSRIVINSDKTIEQLLIGLLNNKLSYIIILEAGLQPEKACGKLTKTEIIKLINRIKSLELHITGTNSFDSAQVSAGGIPTDEINPDTMESKIRSNLYLTGELVDVDGTCGGYNLQWAWSSGYVAGSIAGLRSTGKK